MNEYAAIVGILFTVGVVLHQGEGYRPAGFKRQAAHPGNLFFRQGQVVSGNASRRQLEYTRRHRPTDAEQFVFGGEGSWHIAPINGSVGDRARGGESQCTGFDPLFYDAGHALDVLPVGGLIGRAPFTHNIGANGPVRNLSADV